MLLFANHINDSALFVLALIPSCACFFESRTTPWNTLCVWNLEKLSLIGFASVSDLGKSAGIEECVAIALLQRLFPKKSVAKLVKVEDISWEETFADEERRKWHEEKMKSKLERAAHQLNELGLSGTVLHC
jgi:hypothetical protein